MPAPIHPPYLYKQSNNPARSLNVVFVDGHVETRRIADIPTDFTNVFWTPNR
jgi:prepilin-type processing-associated H-X9-DG protein